MLVGDMQGKLTALEIPLPRQGAHADRGSPADNSPEAGPRQDETVAEGGHGTEPMQGQQGAHGEAAGAATATDPRGPPGDSTAAAKSHPAAAAKSGGQPVNRAEADAEAAASGAELKMEEADDAEATGERIEATLLQLPPLGLRWVPIMDT